VFGSGPKQSRVSFNSDIKCIPRQKFVDNNIFFKQHTKKIKALPNWEVWVPKLASFLLAATDSKDNFKSFARQSSRRHSAVIAEPRQSQQRPPAPVP
jgi:hypothetical protein